MTRPSGTGPAGSGREPGGARRRRPSPRPRGGGDERAASSADVEDELTGPDLRLDDEAEGPGPIELVPSPPGPGLPGHGGPSLCMPTPEGYRRRGAVPSQPSGARDPESQTVGSVRDRHRLHPGLRRARRGAAAPGQHPRARHLRHPAGHAGGRLRGRGGRRGRRWTSPPCPSSWWWRPCSSSSSHDACFPAPTRSTPTRSCPAGRSATSCWPGCSSARPTRRPPTPSAALMERAARAVPRTAGLDEDLVGLGPDLLDGVTPDQLAAAFRRATAERPPPTVDLYHVTVDTVTVADAVDRARRPAARGRARHLPRAHRPPAGPHRDHRALPRPPRAVQAGPGRALTRAGPSASSTSSGWPVLRPPAPVDRRRPRRVRGMR